MSAAFLAAPGNTVYPLEVRVSFIGICAKLSSEWTCSSDFGTVANTDSEATMGTGANDTKSYDPLGLIIVGKKFMTEVLFDGLLSVPFC